MLCAGTSKGLCPKSRKLINYALEICGFFGKEYTPLGIYYVNPIYTLTTNTKDNNIC